MADLLVIRKLCASELPSGDCLYKVNTSLFMLQALALHSASCLNWKYLYN